MGKGIIKYGFKSGILPAAREIFKKPIKPVKLDPSVPQGYAPNIQHPRGSTRDPKVPEPFPVAERIKKTAFPLKQYSAAELAKMTEAQRYKKARSELRKQYLQETLKQEEQRVNSAEARKAAREQQKQHEAERLQNMNFETEVAKLTLPTIESYLTGPLMRHRSRAETKALQLKKRSNRLTHELKVRERKAVNLLDLYYECENFIVDEQELSDAIDSAFQDPGYYSVAVGDTTAKLENYREYEGAYMTKLNDEFNNVIFGTIDKNKPGLYEIEDEISGNFANLSVDAKEKLKEKVALHKEQAQEKQE